MSEGQKNTGIVYKGIGGFYYVKTPESLVECKPRGLFRKEGTRIVAGDRVLLEEEAGTVFISELQPRKNYFIRPPVANVGQFVVVVSTTEPVPSFFVIDKLTAAAIDQEAEVLLAITKTDLGNPAPLQEAYAHSDIPVVLVNAENGEGVEYVRASLQGKLSVFCGNSGVGKSTLLNALLPGVNREIGGISQKLGRGRHTTREVELFELAGGLVADTPGFSSFDLQRAAPIPSENMQFAFPEIRQRITQCRFTGCMHIGEAGCAVCAALEEGQISPSRYESYVTLYKEAKDREGQYSGRSPS